jgi:hypothetical protein
MKPVLTSFFLAALLPGAALLRAAEPPAWILECASGAAVVKNAGGAEVLRYFTTKPEGTAFSANSTCCFHPFTTPAGHAVTAFAPDDHKHHRGIFLAWVELHGAADADFWGWGAHAPVQDRVIVNRSLTPLAAKDGAVSFVAANDWMAGAVTVLQETLTAIARPQGGANVLDLTYTLKPSADVTLARWAFSGFCVRYPKLGEAVVHNPQGIVTLPEPAHVKPDTNWPDAPWYAATWESETGAPVGVAVVPRGAHPPKTWHCPRSIRMLNPAITGPAAVILKGGQVTTLRYQVVAFDGAVPAAMLNQLAQEKP